MRTKTGNVRCAPETSQAARIVKKLGGPYRLAKVLGRHFSGVYKWLWMPPHGTGGRIPAIAVPSVRRAAKALGIELTEEDWGPPPWAELQEGDDGFDPLS